MKTLFRFIVPIYDCIVTVSYTHLRRKTRKLWGYVHDGMRWACAYLVGREMYVWCKRKYCSTYHSISWRWQCKFWKAKRTLWMAYSKCDRCTVNSVSYTHLDVYKRQLLYAKKKEIFTNEKFHKVFSISTCQILKKCL